MIYVDFYGLMGNHMFQLAFAHAAAKRLDTSFKLGPGSLLEGFDCGPWGRPHVRFVRRAVFRVRHPTHHPARVQVDNADDPGQVLAGLRDDVAYSGFFQSERYFAGYEDDVRQLFAIRPEPARRFQARYGSLGRYVCLHMRRGEDYRVRGWDLPTSYFLDALATLGDLGDMPVVVISDAPEAARAALAGVRAARFEVNDAMVDFQLLMNASAVVASNSTFSWWGAWCNRVEGARVIVPENWLAFPDGPEWPRDIIADGWERVAVRAAT